MKTVTAKEFQLNQSHMMKEVAKGTIYQVTYHGKPWVKLYPDSKPHSSAHAGSHESFKESLLITLKGTKLSSKTNYKDIRKQHLSKKYADSSTLL